MMRGRMGTILALMLLPGAAVAKPLDLTLEGRVGPYLPDVDPGNTTTPFSGSSAYACQFGIGVRPSAFVSPQVSIFDMFGTLLVGGEAGFYSVAGQKLLN